MFIVIKKKVLIIISAVLAIIIVASVLFSFVDIKAVAAKQNKRIPIYSVETPEKLVALTFDAAWGADKTEQIVNILSENQARGTFFLVGFWIEKYKDKVRFLHENNIEIGNHSNNHLHMSRLSGSQITQELSIVNESIKEITGTAPKFFRAPFGEYNNTIIENAESLDMQVIQWDVDSLDWKGLSGAEIKNRVMSRVGNGSIILFHNNSDHIVDALPDIISELKEQNYSMVKLSELVYRDNYRIDTSGRQHRIQ